MIHTKNNIKNILKRNPGIAIPSNDTDTAATSVALPLLYAARIPSGTERTNAINCARIARLIVGPKYSAIASVTDSCKKNESPSSPEIH